MAVLRLLRRDVGEESTSALCNWLLKLAQALTPAAYIRLQRQSLIGSGVYRSHRGYRDVAVPAAGGKVDFCHEVHNVLATQTRQPPTRDSARASYENQNQNIKINP